MIKKNIWSYVAYAFLLASVVECSAYPVVTGAFITTRDVIVPPAIHITYGGTPPSTSNPTLKNRSKTVVIAAPVPSDLKSVTTVNPF